VWIKALEIDGFGCLADRSLEFGRGMTAVTGLNESGKSTLHAATLAALFGFFDAPDLRPQRPSEHLRQRFQPWGGAAYGLTAVVERDNGPALRFVWEYENRTRVRVYDALTGADLNADHRGRFEGALDTSALWGASRDFYMRACFVRQGELRALDDADGAITRTVEAIASSGRHDESAQRGLDLLARIIADEIGTDRARVKPLPKARERVEQLSATLEDADARRKDFSELAAEAETAASHAADLDQQARTAEAALAGKKLAALEERIAEAGQLSHQIEEADQRIVELRALAGPELQNDTQIVRLDSARREAAEAIARLERKIEEAAALTAGLVEQTHTLEREVATLEPFADGPDPRALRDLTDAVARLASDEDQPPASVPEKPSELVELERRVAEEADELQRLQREVASSPERRSGWLAAAAGFGAGAVAGVALGSLPVAAVLLLLAIMACLMWWLRRPQIEAAGDDRLTELQGRSGELATRRAAHERAVALAEGALAEHEKRIAGKRASRESAERTVNELLAQFGYADDDRRRGVDAFERAAERRARYAEKKAELEQLRNELTEAQAAQRDRAAREDELAQSSRELIPLYEAASIHEADLDPARAEFDRRVEAHQRLSAATTEKARTAAQLGGLLSGKTLGEFQREHEVLVARGIKPRPDIVDEDEILERRVEEFTRDAREADRAARELKGQLEQALRDLPEPAGLREELERERQRVTDLERARTVLELARDTLEQAAEESYRDIAPRLNEALGGSLGRITAGRYKEAFVDSDYQVRVQSDEKHDLVEADALSHGTREQIYLVQRLELIEILSGDEPLPVLLDDPLSHSDPERRLALAELLAEFSRRRQLIVLATDPAVAETLSGACEDCVVVDLDEIPHAASR
jgi:DNA repair exonuclease SbcCD ATPase subunit